MDNLTQLNQLLDQLENQATDTETAVSNAITLYKLAASQITAINAIQSRAKAVLTDIMSETGRLDWQTDAGRAYLPRPGITIRYDTKRIEALCAIDPGIAAKLAPCRIESERPGSLTIR